jgi:hypothetical protein
MPNRVVREGLIDSEIVNKLPDASECFFFRLLLAADDAGRFDGRNDMLRSRLFPLKTQLRVNDIERRLADCVKEGLVIPYEWAGKRFLQVSKWQRCSPCAVSKFPWHDGSHKIEYVKRDTRDGVKDFVLTSLGDPIGIPSVSHADGIKPLSNGCTDTDTETYTKTKTETNTLTWSERFSRFWEEYPRKTGKGDAEKVFMKLKPSEELVARMINAVKLQKLTRDWIKEDGQYIPHPKTWLNGKRWEDDNSNAFKPEDFSSFGTIK